MDTNFVDTILFSLTAIRPSTSLNLVPTGQLSPKCKPGANLKLILKKHLAQLPFSIPQDDLNPPAPIATLLCEAEPGPLKRGDSLIPRRAT
jgi:hypothetical protein